MRTSKRVMNTKYRSYLRSGRWKRRRKQFIKLAGGGCELCTAKGSQVHHLTYARLGYEADTDLLLLCGKCHQEVHDYPVTQKRIDAALEARTGGRVLAYTGTLFARCERCANPVPTPGYLWQLQGEQYCSHCVPLGAFVRLEGPRPTPGGTLPLPYKVKQYLRLNPPELAPAKPRQSRKKRPQTVADRELWEAENGRFVADIHNQREWHQEQRKKFRSTPRVQAPARVASQRSAVPRPPRKRTEPVTGELLVMRVNGEVLK